MKITKKDKEEFKDMLLTICYTLIIYMVGFITGLFFMISIMLSSLK